jgi:acetyl esterase/lipase
MKLAAALFLASSLALYAAGEGTVNPHAPADVTLIEDVVIGTGGGRELHANICFPKVLPKEPMPAVLMIHGGGWSGGDYKGYHPFFLPQHGYFIAAIEYRLTGEAPWPAQIEDCKLAVRWLRANAAKYHVNPDRIGCMGHSAGGHLVTCLGTLGGVPELEGTGGNPGVSSRVQAVVDEAGPTNFTPEGRPTIGKSMDDVAGLVKLFGGHYADKPEPWKQASSALHVTKDTPPHPRDPRRKGYPCPHHPGGTNRGCPSKGECAGEIHPHQKRRARPQAGEARRSTCRS